MERTVTILIAEDDVDDYLLVREALRELRRDCDLRLVRDGEELFDYLHHRGKYENGEASRPDLILMDLKMPKKDGCEVIRELKDNALFRSIPVVALTTSIAEDDIDKSYFAGANSYIAKPPTFRALVELMDKLSRYWFEVVQLPPTK